MGQSSAAAKDMLQHSAAAIVMRNTFLFNLHFLQIKRNQGGAPADKES